MHKNTYIVLRIPNDMEDVKEYLNQSICKNINYSILKLLEFGPRYMGHYNILIRTNVNGNYFNNIKFGIDHFYTVVGEEIYWNNMINNLSKYDDYFSRKLYKELLKETNKIRENRINIIIDE